MTGLIHSRETFGTVDGPGVRYVLFLSGCPLRCRYCHNPDTWASPAAETLSVEQVLEEYRKNRAFYTSGGITVSGGEPMLQAEFVTALFTAAHAEGIHTCLDTSGAPYTPEKPEAWDALLSVCDLVLLDIKHTDPEAHRALTGASNENVLAFARRLSDLGVPTRLRHVLVPTLTDSDEQLSALAHLAASLRSLESLEFLPYHTLGQAKYQALGLPIPLPDVPEATEADLARAKATVRAARRR